MGFYSSDKPKKTATTSKRTSKANNSPKNKAMPNKPWAPRPENPANKKRNTRTNTKENFINKMENTRQGWYGNVSMPEYKRTENGALLYATTGKTLLDMNYQLSSMRNWSDKQIIDMWRKAYTENPRLAIRWFAYVMDVREGQGERRTSRIILKDIAENGGTSILKNLLPLLPEYSRWDIIYTLIDNKSLYPYLSKVIKNQWTSDVINMNKNKPISLLAKWMDSANSKVPETRSNGLKTAKILGLSETQYRKTLSLLRKHLDIVERKMSSNNWQAIDYEHVPSKANLLYNKAFLRHDEERRRLYLNALTKGEAKINSSVAFPHEIVHKYGGDSYSLTKYDTALEGMWKSLPNLVKNGETTLVVRDDSGTMCCTVDRKSSVTALEVATALSIYFAERAKGPYHNTFLSFSATPKILQMVDSWSLRDKLNYAYKHCEISNTNIEATFQLVLDTAIKNQCSQDELPDNLLFITDGEFDSMTCCGGVKSNWYSPYNIGTDPTFFARMDKKFKDAGYKMPKLIFWNVNNRSGAIPVKEHNKFPAILVSGFSVNTLKMVLSGKTNPWDAFVDTLMVPRYDVIEEKAFGDVVY